MTMSPARGITPLEGVRDGAGTGMPAGAGTGRPAIELSPDPRLSSQTAVTVAATSTTDPITTQRFSAVARLGEVLPELSL